MWKLTAAVIVVLIVGLFWGMAHVSAQGSACGIRTVVIEALTAGGYHRSARAINNNGMLLIELYRQNSGDGWRMYTTSAEQPWLSCLLGKGNVWADIPFDPPRAEGPIS